MNVLMILIISILFITTNSFAIVVRGKVYDREGDLKKHVFEFLRTEKIENGKKIVFVDFKDLSGKLAVSEKLIYPIQPSKSEVLFESYEYQRFQNNEVVKIYPEGTKLFFDYKKLDKIKKNDESIEKNMITRDQLTSIVTQNWDSVMNGEKIKSRFIVPDRAETIGFGLVKDGEEVINGQDTVRIVMKPTSFIIAMIAKQAVFNFEKNGSHRLIRAVGRTPVLKRVGDDLKNIDGIIDFEYSDQ